jgi:hypothetical protein
MTPEDRVRDVLHEDASRYLPASDGMTRINARLAQRRRGRKVRQAAVTLVVVLTVAGVTVAVVERGDRPRQGVTGPPSVTTTRKPSPKVEAAGEVVTMTPTRISFLSPSTGAVERTVDVTPRIGGLGGQMAVDLARHTAFVSVAEGSADPLHDTTCTSNAIVSVDLDTGHHRLLTNMGFAPTVSPDGTELAYLRTSGESCSASMVIIEQLSSHATRSWRIGAAPLAGHVGEQLGGLHWSSEATRLVIDSEFGPYSGIQVLNPTLPLGSSNPAAVGPYAFHGFPGGRYSDGALTPSGKFVGLAPLCWGAMSCPPAIGMAIDPVVVIDPASGLVASTLLTGPLFGRSELDINSIAVDPRSGKVIVLAGVANKATDLYRIVSGRLVLLASSVYAASWADPTKS